VVSWNEDLSKQAFANGILRRTNLPLAQEQLSRVGMRARVTTLEMQTLVHKTTGGDFDAYVGGWKLLGAIDLKPIFGSAGLPPGGNNVVRYRSAEVDGLLERLESVADWKGMKPLFGSVERAIYRDQPYTFLYETQRLAVAGPRLKGVEIPIPSNSLALLERWWVRP
jgi:ABC-type transport system substrate-binding protein